MTTERSRGWLSAGALLFAATCFPSTASPGEVQTLVDEIRAELDRAEQERLADPWFLRDLRGILDRYDRPWQSRLLDDDFSGQGPGPDAPWKVTAGEFLIDWNRGLRSVVKPARQRGQSGSDHAVEQIVGAILNQALGGGQSGQSAASQEPGFAAMIAPLALPNAFSLEVELSSRTVDGVRGGRFELGPYQGADAKAGYRLVYTPGTADGGKSLELLRLSPSGAVTTLDFYDRPVDLEDDETHRLAWTRDETGLMVVRLDGETLMQITDRGFRDAFDGLAVVNGGGDFALRRVVLDGAG